MFLGKNRKVVLINKEFQIRLVSYFLVLSLINTVVVFISMIYFFKKFKNQAIELGLAPDHTFFYFLDAQRDHMSMVYLISTIVMIIIMFVGGLYISHRIAGPIYRLKQHMKNLSETGLEGEEKSKVKFREGDFLVDLQDSFNSFISSLIK